MPPVARHDGYLPAPQTNSSFAPETLIQVMLVLAKAITWSGRKSPKDRVFRVQMAQLHGLQRGVILTTYIHRDDPPTAVDGSEIPRPTTWVGWC